MVSTGGSLVGSGGVASLPMCKSDSGGKHVMAAQAPERIPMKLCEVVSLRTGSGWGNEGEKTCDDVALEGQDLFGASSNSAGRVSMEMNVGSTWATSSRKGSVKVELHSP